MIFQKIISLIMALLMTFFGSSVGSLGRFGARIKYRGEYAEVNGALAGTDALDREVPSNAQAFYQKDKTVGVFYFLWQGEDGTPGPYNNQEIVNAHPEAVLSEQAWMAAGGGGLYEWHFWGEPMFGYYVTSDKWVLRKHVQMLTDAGVDYMIFDTTNARPYLDRVRDLIDVWYEFLEQGYKVPQIAFYTAAAPQQTVQAIYDNIYNNAALREKYPRLDELFFQWRGKPLIVSDPVQLTDELNAYFTVKHSQWPNQGKEQDGWPWMEFHRLNTKDAVFSDPDGSNSIMNVSIAQHCASGHFAIASWYGGTDHTRSWHDGLRDTSPDAVQYGYNFQEQWDYALRMNPDTIFVTGWNEWIAQRLEGNELNPILFCDNATWEGSRDAEPMKGGFGDNYYLQLAENVRRFKGSENRVDVGKNITIDINGSFDQWNNPAITAVYKDYENDTADRDHQGFGNVYYKNTTGRNDFTNMKVAHDGKNVYFYAETAEDIKGDDGDNKMVLFLNTNSKKPDWNNYNFAVNLNGEGKISKCLGGWNWEDIADAEVKTEGNKMMLKVPYSALGIDRYLDKLIDLRFKWADNFQPDENGEYTTDTFYCDGDAAPIGRFDYVYSDVA